MTETFSCAVLARNIIVAGLIAEIYSPYLTWDIELFENAERINYRCILDSCKRAM